jgi:TIR domain
LTKKNNLVVKSTTSTFISYSRKDSAFAERLRSALVVSGFEVYLDTKDIAPGENWRLRLDDLILAADAVVFVISPDSVARWDLPPPDESVCAWEIRRTIELKKQLVPVVWRAPAGQTVPPELRQRNWVSFEACQQSFITNEADFDSAILQLKTALGIVEVLWIREHTKWVARAVEWDRSEPPRSEGKLMRADDIAAVEAWERLMPPNAPQIPRVLADYLSHSIAKEHRDAEKLLRRERQISTSLQRLVAREVERARAGHRHASALRVAIAAEPTDEERSRRIMPEPSRRAHIAGAAHESFSIFRLTGHDNVTRSAVFSTNAERILTSSDDKTARVWDAASGAELVSLGHQEALRQAFFSPDDRTVLTIGEHTAWVWGLDESS